MTIGIYGGSFDPIHTGHAIVANFVAQCNVVDEVWLMVNRRNPLKKNGTIASDSDRLEMASLVAEECCNVIVSDIELRLPTPSYTYDTLKTLKETIPDNSYMLIIGSDSLEGFHNWKNSDKIIKEFGIIVYPRPGYPLPEKEPAGFTFLNGAPEFNISSTLIREYIKDGWNVNFFLPVSVSEFIEKKKLYKK